MIVMVAVGGCVVASLEPESAADPFFSGGATVIRSSQTLPTGLLDSGRGEKTIASGGYSRKSTKYFKCDGLNDVTT